MGGEEVRDASAQRLLTMRIVHGAIVAGSGVFAVVVAVIRATGGARPAPEVPVLTYVSLGYAALGVIAFLTVPGLLEKAWRGKVRQGINPLPGAPPSRPEDTWCGIFQTRLIIRCALLEGIIFLGLIAYLVEGQVPALALAGGLWLWLISLFPTQEGFESWARRQEDLLEEDKLRAG